VILHIGANNHHLSTTISLLGKGILYMKQLVSIFLAFFIALGALGTPVVVAQAQTCTAPPNVPQGLTPNGQIQANVTTISWQPVPGATSYSIKVQDLGSTVEAPIENIGNTTSYPFRFTLDHRYHIWVRAENACGTSGFAEADVVVVQSVVSPTPTTPPADVYEPNNSWEAASYLVPNYEYAGLTIGQSDVDWFTFTLSQGLYTFSVKPSNPAIALNVGIYQGQGTSANDCTSLEGSIVGQVLRSDGNGSFPLVQANITNNLPVKVCVSGADKNVDYTAYGSYSLSVMYTTAGGNDMYDVFPNSNNTEETATAIVAGQKIENLTLTAGDHDFFKVNIDKGKYAGVVTSSNDTLIDPDMKVKIIHQDGRTETYVVGNDGGPVNPQIQFAVDAPAIVYFDIYGNQPNADYSKFGTYSFHFAYVPQIRGTEDSLEPNNSEDKATVIGYDQEITGLTMFSTLQNPDEDYFTFVAPKDMDMHCEAVSTSSNLDLVIYGHVAGRGDYGDKIRPDIFTNYEGVNPRVVLHNVPANTQIFFKVALENPTVVDPAAGAVQYTFRCKTGLGYPPKPTAAPTTPPSPPSGGVVTPPTATPQPTPTPLPQSIPFAVKLTGVQNPTPVIPNTKIYQYSFAVFNDINGNGKIDLDEGVAGIKIFIQDTKTKKIVKVIETNELGQISMTLKDTPSQYHFIIPLLNINAAFSANSSPEFEIKVPNFSHSSVIP